MARLDAAPPAMLDVPERNRVFGIK